MSKAKVIYRNCICGYHAWFKSRMIATITKRGYHWEVSDAESLPSYVLDEVEVFAAFVAQTD